MFWSWCFPEKKLLLLISKISSQNVINDLLIFFLFPSSLIYYKAMNPLEKSPCERTSKLKELFLK